jgi:uncharacterized protein YndB with AHSA1/START domain
MTTRTATVTTPTDHEIVITREFNAPRRLVFEAWTNPEYLPQWMLGPEGWTMALCEIDLRPGGPWRCLWRSTEGAEMNVSGTYREVTPPDRVVYTESWGGPLPESLCILDFTERSGVTTMVNTLRYPSKEDRDAAIQTGMADGTAATLDHLEAFLASLG